MLGNFDARLANEMPWLFCEFTSSFYYPRLVGLSLKSAGSLAQEGGVADVNQREKVIRSCTVSAHLCRFCGEWPMTTGLGFSPPSGE